MTSPARTATTTKKKRPGPPARRKAPSAPPAPPSPTPPRAAFTPVPPAPPEDPVASLRRALAAHPADARLHLSLGHELSTRRRYEEAEVSVRAALALDPALAMAHNNLGWVRQMQGDEPGAVAAYQRALALEPGQERARRNLATLFWNQGRLPEALALRLAEVGDRPESARARAELVDSAMRADDLPLAAEHAARYAELCRGTRWWPVRRADDPPVPEAAAWAPMLTPSKVLHDIEQFEYLRRRGILGPEFGSIIAKYEGVLDTLRPLGPDARVPLRGVAKDEIGHVYNRLVHVRPTPRVDHALSRRWDRAAVQGEYLDSRPNVVVVDDFLSADALQSLRLFCLESTFWSSNHYGHGRLGSFFRDGFNCPLLVQIAAELRAALPRLLGGRHRVTQVWGFKYATVQPHLSPHADFAAVNVNLWITPDEANLDPGAGGLALYDVAAPRDWDFDSYNRGGQKIRSLLADLKAEPTYIPYRYNRAVIFDSDLFHATPSVTFKGGFENRRMNVTVLFGDRLDA